MDSRVPGKTGIDFFSGTVESVRRTLKRLRADADWPDRSARPGLLPEVCVHRLVSAFTSVLRARRNSLALARVW